MKSIILKTTLEKAVFLAETTKTNHEISIRDLGTFYIQENNVLLRTIQGTIRHITKESLEFHFKELTNLEPRFQELAS
ncbi:MAG: hypothetical protein COB67_12085 [SAR324 cluster bacterium]|uniref:Uncharacterized protein n=1 Tax=SAR324 cluster bacterium TaxID=2024889 RepID=A0A2A4SSE8_9DELT|nr:MAG: hypothetical protein COB67_12085 [SAR324 cluster bacterium]